MVQRCTNKKRPDYPRYGGRGVAICDRWRYDFKKFAVDMGPKPSPRHTIDRKDNSGDYEPSNCRWATPHEQALNKTHPRVRMTGEHNIELRNGRYRVQLKRFQKQNHVGTFDTLKEAIHERDKYIQNNRFI